MSLMRRLAVGGGVIGTLGWLGYKACQSHDKREQEAMIDETIDESFPASDPPAWTSDSGVKAASLNPKKSKASA